MEFKDEEIYYCEFCNKYSMEVVSVETSFYSESAILKCTICGEIDERSILINF